MHDCSESSALDTFPDTLQGRCFETEQKDHAVLCTILPLKVLTCASTTHRRQAASAASRLQGLCVLAMPAKLEASLPGRATIAEIRSFAMLQAGNRCLLSSAAAMQ